MKFHAYTFFHIETNIFLNQNVSKDTAIACLDSFQISTQTEINHGRNTKRLDTRHRPDPSLPEHAAAGARHDHAPGLLHREVHELGPFPDGGDAHCRRKRLTAYPLCLTSCQVEAMAFLAIIDVGVGCGDCPLQI